MSFCSIWCHFYDSVPNNYDIWLIWLMAYQFFPTEVRDGKPCGGNDGRHRSSNLSRKLSQTASPLGGHGWHRDLLAKVISMPLVRTLGLEALLDSRYQGGGGAPKKSNKLSELWINMVSFCLTKCLVTAMISRNGRWSWNCSDFGQITWCASGMDAINCSGIDLVEFFVLQSRDGKNLERHGIPGWCLD